MPWCIDISFRGLHQLECSVGMVTQDALLGSTAEEDVQRHQSALVELQARVTALRQVCSIPVAAQKL